MIFIDHDDCESESITVFFDEGFKVRDVEAGARAIRIEEVYEERLSFLRNDLVADVYVRAHFDGLIVRWYGSRKIVPPLIVPEYIADPREEHDQPAYHK